VPNQRFQALLKRANQPAIWLIAGVLSLALISLSGCASATPSMARITHFFTGSSPAATPAPSPTAASSAPISPAEETSGHPARKTARPARATSENAAAASRQAATASKQAAGVANQVEGSGNGADVSLEGSSVAATAGASATPSAAASVGSVAPAAATPTMSSSALESPQSSADSNPAKATKLIEDIYKIEKRVDRKNLSADDSQRDILAQKLLQDAKKALAERDSVAAISLASKASTLLAPLPKLVDSANPSAP
jgi:hypothetical protein